MILKIIMYPFLKKNNYLIDLIQRFFFNYFKSFFNNKISDKHLNLKLKSKKCCDNYSLEKTIKNNFLL